MTTLKMLGFILCMAPVFIIALPFALFHFFNTAGKKIGKDMGSIINGFANWAKR